MSDDRTVTVDAEVIRLAKAATHHVLGAIAEDPRKYYLMGGKFSGSWEKLTAAHAALNGMTVEAVQSGWQPNEKAYQRYLDQREDDERLLRYCRENGIKVT